MKRTGSLLVLAGAFALIFHVSSQWIEPPVQAATQDPELNQIISSLRSIENRLSRIESASILRDSYEPSSARLSRMESDLSSVAGIGSDLARIESRIVSLSSGEGHVSRIDQRLSSLEANVEIIVNQVCADTDEC